MRRDMETLYFHSLKILAKIHRNYMIIVTSNAKGIYICTSYSSRYVSVNCRIKRNGQPATRPIFFQSKRTFQKHEKKREKSKEKRKYTLATLADFAERDA